MASKLQHMSATPREFTLQYLEHITDSFSKDHIIGRGEHGVVYKGVLDNGEEIALKKLYHKPELDDTQFRIELNNLVRARHQNIIRLIGYCCNIGHKRVKHDDEYTSAVVEERFLCFEYLQGESLDNYISDESCALDWLTCFKIIKGVCEGLNYLHNGTNDHIFHLHLKPSNILLDKNMMPKIGDFVYSRLFSSAKICVTAKAIEQTWRYKPPEYIYKGETTSKFDIFSLGVIIIEVMARFIGYSRRADMSCQELLDLVHLNWKKKLVAMTSCETSQQFRVCLEIALRCLEDDQMNRPAIAEIIKELNKLNTAESSFTGEAEMDDRGSEWLQAAMELPVSASLGPIGSLFRKLHSFKDTNESLPAGVNEGEIHSLKKELEELCTSLMDLSEANDTSFTAKYWMKEVREVCYDIENYFDKLIMQPSNGSNVRWIHKLLKRQPQMAIDFSTLVARVADARERRGRLVKWNIEQESGQASTAPAIASSSSSTLSLQQPVQVACVRRPELTLKLSVPAAAHMDDLVNLLAFDDENQKRLKVVSIFGYAGVGKTTVARILYRKFGGKFDCRAFVRMSRQPDIRRLLTSMLSQIKAPPAHAFADVQVLVGIIRTHLEHKRYFLIIDELWTPSVWNTIRRAFPDGNCCSRVITTTENEDAALACSSYQSKYIFKMRSVSGYQSIELLSSGVYDSVRSSHQDFKELSYGVITTSGGLPLASLNTGSISEPNLIREQWEQIRDSLASTLSANPTCEVMEEVINLIYNSLPHHLKTCLLYLNVYPEGYTIWKYVLVGQWIAEGFIAVTRKKKGFVAAVKQQDTEEEDNIKEKVRVAQGYFVQLACRGMIQAVDTNAKGEVLSCTVHHMVLDLIRRKCMEDNFITTMDKFPSTLVFPDMVRRLSIQFGDAKVAKIPENMTYSQVQSLIYFGSFECAPSTGDYRFLRVLNLHIWADQDKTIDLTTISEIFWLKYFKVDCNTTVNLPATVRMLQNLGTLEVDAPLSVVPSDIFSLKSLLHLSLPSHVNLPDGIVDMTSLRSLRYFSLSTNSADNVLGLGKLIKLWDLRVTCSTVKAGSLSGNMKHFGSILGEFKELQSLIMESETSNVNISCDYLSSVSCAPALLERVEFPRTFIFPSLPKWFGDLEKLSILKVTVRETSTEDIDILKGLNALTSLSICVSITPEARIVFDKDGFTLLRYFKFTSGALCLTFDLGAMPNIERLKLRFDAKFFEQSDLRQAGIENLLGLKEVSAKIGILDANESDTKAALLIAIFRTHPSSPIFNVQSVDRTFDVKSTVRYEEKHQTTETQDVHVGTMLFDSRSTVAPETSLPMQILGEVTHNATNIQTTLEATFSKPPEEHLITAEISEEGFNEQHEIHFKDCQEDDNAHHDSRNSPPRSSIISNLQDLGEVGDKVTNTEYPLEPKFIKLPEEHLCTYEISKGGFDDPCAIQEKNTREDDNTQATRTYAPPGSISYPHDPCTDNGNLHRSSTMPGVIKDTEITTETTGPSNLERSKTERRKQSNPADDPAKQLLDDKISIRKKLKMLNRIATVKDDGTVVVNVPSTLEATPIDVGAVDGYEDVVVEESLDGSDIPYKPPIQIVILIVGTRGDVQPFVAIGKRLQDYGHRVRLATHANYKEFILTAGLEFFPLGGDPKVLAEYMVKNKGFLPSGPSEIPIQRKQMKEIIFSLYPACKDPDPDTGIPFKVDAIIANPPAYGHTHVAEALKVPIHIFFTMPWTPTSEFPHPLSRVKTSAGYRLSYQIIDSMIWLGIRDMINEFRKKKLKLRPVTYLSGAQGSGSDIPHGYIWSPHLVPKPKDWGPKIDVVGFCFLDLASDYVPPEELVKWLEVGDKPIYVGFGSLPVQDPAKMTETIVKALEMTGQRGIINKGWGGLGTLAEPKDSIYVLDNCPHDWLFLQCKAVVHHGGAGTTAAGLKAACPTTIVPFFGDQPFWGERVHARGVGPSPIPVDQFNLQKLVDAINFMLDPEVKEKAVELAKAMESEDGVTGAVRAFLKHLPCKTDENSPPPTHGFLEFLGPVSKCLGCS